MIDLDGGWAESLGATLRHHRGAYSLREVTRHAGVSSSYLSQIERGTRTPSPRLLTRLAGLYGVPVHPLLARAGYLGPDEAAADPALGDPRDVERAYQFVLADPKFRVGTRPTGPLTLGAKRFIVEMYERLTGKVLLG